MSPEPLLILAVAMSANRSRVDFYDLQGRRTGYALVDRESGRVDFYDAQSRRTGWGRVTPRCTVELFDLKGRRLPEIVRPWCWQRLEDRGQ